MFDGLYAVVMSGSLIGIFLQVVPITFLVGLVYAIYRLRGEQRLCVGFLFAT